jgi:hypothetical protein
MNLKSRHLRRCIAGGLFAMVAVLLIGGTASASPVMHPQWQSEGAFVPYGQTLEVSGSSNAGLNLHATGSGVPLWVTCSTLAVNGKIENPSKGASGRLFNSAGGSLGPSGEFHNCELIEWGEQAAYNGTECFVPKNIPAELSVGTLENNLKGEPELKIQTTFEFTTECPVLRLRGQWKFTISGTGTPVSKGQFSFPSETNVLKGPAGTASYGIGIAHGAAPISVAEMSYEQPYSTSGHLWYRGGTELNLTEGPLTLIKAGSPAGITGSAALNIESMQAGLLMAIACQGGVTGSIENPSGGGAGVASVGLSLTECAVQKPAGMKCSIVGGGFTTNAMPGVVNPSEGFPPMTLNPSLGQIAQFEIHGCTYGALNHAYTLNGKMVVQPQMMATGTPGVWSIPLKLNEAVKTQLHLFGQPASASGTLAPRTSGEAVTMG